MDWETARRWLEIMAKNVFDPNQPAYIVVLQRVEELEAALKLGAEAYVAALPDASTDAMTDLTIERNALRHENERLREACIRKDYDYGLKIRHLREAVREIRGRALASMGRDIGKVEARARLDCIAKLARAALRGGE